MKTITNINEAVNFMYRKVIEEDEYDFTIPCEIGSGDGVIKEIQLLEVDTNKFELCISTERFYHRNYYHGKKKVKSTMTMLHKITKNKDAQINAGHFCQKTIKIVGKGR